MAESVLKPKINFLNGSFSKSPNKSFENKPPHSGNSNRKPLESTTVNYQNLYEEALREISRLQNKSQEKILNETQPNERSLISDFKLEYKVEALVKENERLTRLVNEKFNENHKLLDYEARVIVLTTDKEKLQLGLLERDKKLEFLKGRLENLDKTKKKQEKAISSLEEQLALKTNEFNSLSKEYAGKANEINEYLKEKNAKDDSFKEFETKIIRFLDENEKLRALVNKQEEKIREIEEKNRALAIESREKDQVLMESKGVIEKIRQSQENINKDFESKLTQLITENSNLTAKLKSEREKLPELLKEIGVLRKTIDEFQQKDQEKARFLIDFQRISEERERLLSQKELELSEREQIISKKDMEIGERDLVIGEKERGIRGLEQRIIEKEQKIREKDIEISQIVREIGQRENEIREKNWKISEKDQKINEKEQKIQEKDQKLQNMAFEISDLTSQIDSNAKELASLREQTQKILTEKNEELLRKGQELSREISSNRERECEKQRMIAEKDKSLSESIEKLSLMGKELTEKTNKIQSLLEINDRLNKNLEAFRLETEEENRRKSLSTMDASFLSKELDILKKEASLNQQKISQMSYILSEKNVLLEEMGLQIERNRSVEEAYHDLMSKITEMAEALGLHSTEESSSYLSEIEDKIKELLDIETNHSECQYRQEDMNQRLSNEIARNQTLCDQLNEISRKNQLKEQDVLQKLRGAKDQENELRELQNLLDRSRDELDSLQRAYSETKVQNQRKTDELAREYERRLGDANRKTEELVREYERRQCESKRKHEEEKQELIREKQVESLENQRKITEITSLFQADSKENQRKITELTSKFQAEAAEYRLKLQELAQKLEQETQKRTNDIMKSESQWAHNKEQETLGLKAQLAELLRDNSETTRRLNDKNREYNELEHDYMRIRENLEQEQGMRKDREEEIDRLKVKIEDLERELEKMGKETSEKEQELNEKQQELNEKQQEISQKEQEISQKEQEIIETEEKLGLMIEENEHILGINEEKERENMSLRRELGELQEKTEKIGELEEDLRLKEDILEVLKRKCQEQEKEFGETNALRTQIKHWKQLHENARGEINKLYSLIAEKQEENEQLLVRIKEKKKAFMG